jgi:hypothetical protein
MKVIKYSAMKSRPSLSGKRPEHYDNRINYNGLIVDRHRARIPQS